MLNNKKDMKQGDKIIWNSGWGYDLGYFIVEDDSIMGYSCIVELITGVIRGKTYKSLSEIYPYTEELHNQMIKDYGYKKEFPNRDSE